MTHDEPNHSLDIQLTLAGDFVVRPGWTLGPRQLLDNELVYFPSGSNTIYRTPTEEWKLTRPTLVLTRIGEEHAYEFDAATPVRHLFVHFRHRLPASADNPRDPGELQGVPTLTPLVEAPVIPMLLHHVMLSMHTHGDAAAELARTLVRSVLLELIRVHSPAETEAVGRGQLPGPIVQTMHYIDKHLGDPLHIHDLALVSGWSHEHFTRIFRSAVGMTPSRYVAERRMERASQLLTHTTKSVREVADDCGFPDEHYFSRVFARLKGVPPTRYRKLYSDPRTQHVHPSPAWSAAYPLNQYFGFLRRVGDHQ